MNFVGLVGDKEGLRERAKLQCFIDPVSVCHMHGRPNRHSRMSTGCLGRIYGFMPTVRDE